MNKSAIIKKKAIMEAEKSQFDLSVVGGMNCHYSGKGAVRQAVNRSEMEMRSNFKRHNKEENLMRQIKEEKKMSAKTTKVEYKK